MAHTTNHRNTPKAIDLVVGFSAWVHDVPILIHGMPPPRSGIKQTYGFIINYLFILIQTWLSIITQANWVQQKTL